MRLTHLTALLILFITSQTVIAQNFYGVTWWGGDHDAGTIYRTDSLGDNFTSLYHLNADSEGGYPPPQALCYVPSTGNYYGTAASVLFEYDYSTNVYTPMHTFTSATGKDPVAGLLLSSNGKLYGTTSTGGALNGGTVFEFDPATGIYTLKFSFDPSVAYAPYCGLTEDGSGNLLGTLQSGTGATADGCIFTYNLISGTVTYNEAFALAVTGGMPIGNLLKATNGSYYGICSSGGAVGYGTLFEYEPLTDTIINHYDVDWSAGYNFNGFLTEIPGGKIYGLAKSGGTSSSGTVYEFNINTNVFTLKLNLDGYVTGGSPRGGFAYDALSGKLYTCMDYADVGYGGVMEYNPGTNNMVTKYFFPDVETGSEPASIPVILPGGTLLGMCSSGGIGGFGTLFSYSLITDVHTKLLDFNFAPNGMYPSKGLTLAGNGKLYGVTEIGGIYNHGVLYEYEMATNTYTKKHDFDEVGGWSIGPGAGPALASGSPLFAASNGKLYGCTIDGGLNNVGTLYEYDPFTDTYTVKHHFDFGGSYGISDRLIEVGGYIYGVSAAGGAYGGGTIFKYDLLSGVLTVIHDFDNTSFAPGGMGPKAGFAWDGADKFFSLCYGGTYNYGIVYDFDMTSNTLTKLYDVNVTGPGTEGYDATYSPIRHSDGNYYGTTHMGQGYVGCTGYGSIYKFDPLTNTYTTIQWFDGSAALGNTPECSLLEGPTGDLYGTVAASGLAPKGNFYEHDPLTNTHTVKHHFMGPDGALPLGHLLYVSDTSTILGTKEPVAKNDLIGVYPNPAADQVYLVNVDGNYDLQIFSMSGETVITIFDDKNVVDVSDLPNGLYTMRVKTDAGVAYQKFVIQR